MDTNANNISKNDSSKSLVAFFKDGALSTVHLLHCVISASSFLCRGLFYHLSCFLVLSTMLARISIPL